MAEDGQTYEHIQWASQEGLDAVREEVRSGQLRLQEELRSGHNAMQVTMNEILLQTRTTNGRVNKLEVFQATLRGAGMAVVVMLGVPAALYALALVGRLLSSS